MAINRENNTILKQIRHHLNGLHIYCRLHSLGISNKTSMRISRLWERLVHPFIY